MISQPEDHATLLFYEEYHPYGTSSYRAHDNAVDVSTKRYRYTGMERDEETGLGYHTARYYAPWLGRWTAADPIGLGDGVNRYRYAGANPTRLGDPSGTNGDPTLLDALAARQGALLGDIARASAQGHSTGVLLEELAIVNEEIRAEIQSQEDRDAAEIDEEPQVDESFNEDINVGEGDPGGGPLVRGLNAFIAFRQRRGAEFNARLERAKTAQPGGPLPGGPLDVPVGQVMQAAPGAFQNVGAAVFLPAAFARRPPSGIPITPQRARALRSAISDAKGRLVGAAELPGIRFTIEGVEAQGFRLVGAVKIRGNQGIDLLFEGIGANKGRIALAEAKSSASLSSLKRDTLQIRQGSVEFFRTRANRAGRADITAKIDAGEADLFIGLGGSGRLFKVDPQKFKVDVDFRKTPDAVKLVE